MSRRLPVAFSSVHETVAAVRGGSCSAVEIAEAALRRIEEMDSSLGAFTVLLGERALEQARAVDRRVGEGVELPLAGVPWP
jgi:amidase